MPGQKIEYYDQQTLLKGYVAADDISGKTKKPAVLIVHDWSGCNDFVRDKADKLAALGYVGFAVDMYGNGATGETKEEKGRLMSPLMENRHLLRQRIQAALDTVKNLAYVDVTKTAAIGFCFGGTCALELARSGAAINGVVSFHGGLAQSNIENQPIKAKILAIHGYDDPLVTLPQVAAFELEMTVAQVDWQVHVYGGAMHGFTNPKANDPVFGTVYNTKADQRSWKAMKDFFVEIF